MKERGCGRIPRGRRTATVAKGRRQGTLGVSFRYDQHRAMGAVGEGRYSGTGVSEVTPEKILRKQVGSQLIHPEFQR